MRPQQYRAATPATLDAADAHERLLLAQVADRKHEALQELYLAYHRRLTRFLMRFTRQYEQAEEIINDTFWVVWQKAGGFRGDARVSTWIMGIAYRRALNTLRSARRVRLVEGDEAPGIDEPVPRQELQDLLSAALNCLPADHRITIELAYYLGHSCEEISEIMGCPVNTVKTRMFYARARLQVLVPQLDGSAPG